MIGYLVIFIAGGRRVHAGDPGHLQEGASCSRSTRSLDEILGGLLGVVQGFLLLLFLVIILDQYFLHTHPADEDELGVPARLLGRDRRSSRQAGSSTRT